MAEVGSGTEPDEGSSLTALDPARGRPVAEMFAEVVALA